MTDLPKLGPLGGQLVLALHGVADPAVTNMGDGRVLAIVDGVTIHAQADELQATVANLAAAIDAAVGWHQPDTVLVDQLDDTVVGAQIRTSVYVLSDGYTTWGRWSTVVEYHHDPIGWGRRLILDDGTVLELGNPDDCVQIRRRVAAVPA